MEKLLSVESILEELEENSFTISVSTSQNKGFVVKINSH